MRRRLTESPTITLIGVFLLVFALQRVVAFVATLTIAQSVFALPPGLVRDPIRLFALSPPVTQRPWTIVTSVYAHQDLSHLFSNVVLFALVGFAVERETTPLRFHAYFLATGVLSGLAQIWTTAALAGVVPDIHAGGVIGASGAILALLGYVVTSNRLTDRVVAGSKLTPRVQILLFALVAAAVTVATAGKQVALVAHFTGLLLGLFAGRAHVLRRSSSDPTPDPI